MTNREYIESGKAVLGIEFGSTRIKAVLIGGNHEPLAAGSHSWENRLDGQVWTYTLEDIWEGLQECYRSLKKNVADAYGVTLRKLDGMGISAMMHGYMAFDRQGELLVPFRTWRNTMTEQASEQLTEAFGFHIPQRWSIAHLYQAVLNKEEHVGSIAFLTTLAGYVHWKLTGEKVLGIGDASGMFPIDSAAGSYDTAMLHTFAELVRPEAFSWNIEEILPKVLSAGEMAGVLSEEGAALLDSDGDLEAGTALCPPEGDAGTGMAATNSVAARTGNVSAGTSVFAMVVMEENMKHLHKEIDMVTTPCGKPVAMVHCNNCTSDINAWVNLFRELMELMGAQVDMGELYTRLFEAAQGGDSDCGGLLSYNYFSGEGITSFDEGRPMFIRRADASFSLANFMRTHLYSALATLKIGLEILEQEHVAVDRMYGHGGFFTTKVVGQSIMAAAMNTPVFVMETAGEGGAWGIGLLAAYMQRRKPGETLEAYLEQRVFSDEMGSEVLPDLKQAAGFDAFMERYKNGLAVERSAVEKI